jgi:hypothetical protein
MGGYNVCLTPTTADITVLSNLSPSPRTADITVLSDVGLSPRTADITVLSDVGLSPTTVDITAPCSIVLNPTVHFPVQCEAQPNSREHCSLLQRRAQPDDTDSFKTLNV